MSEASGPAGGSAWAAGVDPRLVRRRAALATAAQGFEPLVETAATSEGVLVSVAGKPQRSYVAQALRAAGYAVEPIPDTAALVVQGWDANLLRERAERLVRAVTAREYQQSKEAEEAIDVYRMHLGSGADPCVASRGTDRYLLDRADARVEDTRAMYAPGISGREALAVEAAIAPGDDSGDHAREAGRQRTYLMAVARMEDAAEQLASARYSITDAAVARYEFYRDRADDEESARRLAVAETREQVRALATRAGVGHPIGEHLRAARDRLATDPGITLFAGTNSNSNSTSDAADGQPDEQHRGDQRHETVAREIETGARSSGRVAGTRDEVGAKPARCSQAVEQAREAVERLHAQHDDSRGDHATDTQGAQAEATAGLPPDLRKIAATEPAPVDEHTARVPTAEETAESIQRAQRALTEIAERDAADQARAEHERAADLARWHTDNTPRTDQPNDEHAGDTAAREQDQAGGGQADEMGDR